MLIYDKSKSLNPTKSVEIVKPTIFFANLTISYYPVKYRELARTKPDVLKQNHLQSFLDKEEICILMSINNLVFPNKEYHDKACDYAWKKMIGDSTAAANDKSRYVTWISKIEILKDLGKINYEITV